MIVNKKSNKGFTLIELIASIAILLIILEPFLYMFFKTLTVITKSGKNSITQYSVQEDIEKNISDPSNIKDNVITNNDSVNLNFNGKNYNVQGRKIIVKYNYNSIDRNLVAFTIN